MLVRRAFDKKPGQQYFGQRYGGNFQWHRAHDHLAGTEPLYGNFQNDPMAIGNFGRPFNHIDFDQFLFMSGDSKLWMVINRTEIANHVNDNIQFDWKNEIFKPVTYEGGYNGWRGTTGIDERGPELFSDVSGQITPNIKNWNKWYGPVITIGGDTQTINSSRQKETKYLYLEGNCNDNRDNLLYRLGMNVFIRKSDSDECLCSPL